jgi:predicted ATPase
MLTRLEIDGFKSLRDFEIDLEPLTVLVGPNGAGKSNILEALGLVSRLGEHRPEEALKLGRGRASDQFWRHGEESAQRIGVVLDSLDPDWNGDVERASRQRYQIQLTRSGVGASERVRLEKSVRFIAAEGDRWFKAHSEWHTLIHRWREDSSVLHQVQEVLPTFRALQLNAAHLRESSERIDTGELASDASNLPSVLASLSETTLGDINAELVNLIPGLAGFHIVEHDESYQIELQTIDGDVVPARLASDGTLRMLALLTAVLGEQAWDSLICIEEPENGIYPGRLRRLIDLLREATAWTGWHGGARERPPPQVIVTTHSPVFLAALREQPQSLRYVDVVRRDRCRVTRARALATGEQHEPGRYVSLREIEAVLAGIWPNESDR